MSASHDELLRAIASCDRALALRILESGLDVDVVCDDGATVLFAAILSGDAEVVRALLLEGADPNFVAQDVAAIIYTEKPLDLALQARFVMDWEKYQPIVELLEAAGATDAEGFQSDKDIVEQQRASAKEWQARRRRT